MNLISKILFVVKTKRIEDDKHEIYISERFGILSYWIYDFCERIMGKKK